MPIPLSPSPSAPQDKRLKLRNSSTARSLPGLAFIWISALLCVICALCVPFTYYRFDVAHCWSGWSQATHGATPWLPYQLTPDCNYPAFMLYIFTGIEKIRRVAHAPALNGMMLTLFKAPSILSIFGGALLCRYGLRARLGERYAAAAAAVYAASATLWFNGAVWGQYDAVMCLGLTAVVVALINDEPGWCGVALGLALTVKLQAIVIVPALGVYWLRRGGWRAAVTVAGAAAVAWGLISAPFFVGGGGHGLIQSYMGAVGFYHLLGINAWNVWALFLHFVVSVLHSANYGVDTAKPFHLLTLKQIGMLMYGAYTLFLLWGLWHRPTRYNGVLACVMGAFAFFMLPTEIHERYIVPAAVLATALIPASSASRNRWVYSLFVALSIMATLEEAVNCEFNYNSITAHIGFMQTFVLVHMHIEILASIFNVLLFAWASVMYYRETYKHEADSPDLLAPSEAMPSRPASDSIADAPSA